ncbi:MAG: 2Fe-2S iron-sulfur cluster-binding protein, partial [Terriglobales bacterium]
MAEEQNKNTGTATAELSPNTARVTFLPEGRTVEFEIGKLPYKDHGKPQSILDVAINNNVFLDHACGGNCACT